MLSLSNIIRSSLRSIRRRRRKKKNNREKIQFNTYRNLIHFTEYDCYLEKEKKNIAFYSIYVNHFDKPIIRSTKQENREKKTLIYVDQFLSRRRRTTHYRSHAKSDESRSREGIGGRFRAYGLSMQMLCILIAASDHDRSCDIDMIHPLIHGTANRYFR